MSTAAAVGAAIAAAAPFIEKILEWSEQGLSDKQIAARLADPDGVGEDLIAGITRRRKRGRDLLGRDPDPAA